MHENMTKGLIGLAAVSIPTGTAEAYRIVAATVLDDTTLIPLGVVLLCTWLVVRGTWRAVNEFRDIKEFLKDLKHGQQSLSKRLERIEEICPCQSDQKGKRK